MEENNSRKDWNSVRISTGQYGKPYIEGDETFNYSISHSGEYVLCATDSVPIGADIQELKSYKMAMAKRFFNEKEYERIENTPENDRIYEFYKIWTAKESAVKLSGRGMGEGIEHLVTNKTYNTIKNIVSKKSLNIKIYDEIEGYMVCACSNGEDFPCSLKIIGGLVC
jgi:4'-phosphopantetheinyl transferase